MEKTRKRPFLILGQNIAEARKKMGLGQEAFADRAGVAISAFKDIERGVSEGHIDTRLAIAKTLGYSLSDLYKEPAQGQTIDLSAAADFLSTFSSLKPRARRFALALIYGDPDILSTIPAEISSQFPNAVKAKRVKS